MDKELKQQELIIFQNKQGEISFRGDFKHETIWASLDQIARLFGRDKSVISRHLKKVYQEEELTQEATVAKNATVQIEGNREVVREIEYYNLDAVISVGYRVNSESCHAVSPVGDQDLATAHCGGIYHQLEAGRTKLCGLFKSGRAGASGVAGR
jgi:hypothetical protein